MTNTLNTELILAEQATKLEPSDKLKYLKDEIPLAVEKTKGLLESYQTNAEKFLEEHDEKDVTELIKETAETLKVVKDINDTRASLKKYLNDERDRILDEYDNFIDKNNLLYLESANKDLKQLKKDLSFKRIELRWNELEETFVNALAHYPVIRELTPELLDYNTFKLRHPKLVNGAKVQKPKKDKAKAEIRQIVDDYNKALLFYEEYASELKPNYQLELLANFKKEPAYQFIIDELSRLKVQQQADEIEEKERLERQKREQEAALKRQKEHEEALKRREKELQEKAKLLKDKEDKLQAESLKQEQAIIQKQKERLETLKQTTPRTLLDKYPNYKVQLQMANKTAPLHGNARNKARVLYNLYTNLTNKDSAIYQDTKADPEQILELTRYILDL